MIHHCEEPKPKLIDYNSLLLELRELSEQVKICQKLRDEIAVRNETENSPNWIGTEFSKQLWNHNTKGLAEYLEILEDKLRRDILKLKINI